MGGDLASLARGWIASAAGLFVLIGAQSAAADAAPAAFGTDGYAQLEVVTQYGSANDIVKLDSCPTGKVFDTEFEQFMSRDQTIDLAYTVTLPNTTTIQMAEVDIQVKNPLFGLRKCHSRILPKPYLSPLYVVGGVNTKLNFPIAPQLIVRTKPADDFIQLTAGILQQVAKVSTVTAPFADSIGAGVTHALNTAGASLDNVPGAVVSVDSSLGPLTKSWVLQAAQFGGASDITMTAHIVRVASIFNEQDVPIDKSLLHSKSPSTLLGTPYYNQVGSPAQTVDQFTEMTAKASYVGLGTHTKGTDLSADCDTIANALSQQGVTDSDIGIIVRSLAHNVLDPKWGGFLPEGDAIDSMACILGRKDGLAAVGLDLNLTKKDVVATSPPSTDLMGRTVNFIPPDSTDQQTDLNVFSKGSQAGDDVTAVSQAAVRLFIDAPVVTDSAGLVFKAPMTLKSNFQWPTFENYVLGSPFLVKLGCYSFFDMAKVTTLGVSGMVALGLTPGDPGRPAASVNKEVVIEYLFAPSPDGGPAKIAQVIVMSDFDPAVPAIKAYVLKLWPSKTCGAGSNAWSPKLLAH
jgi:hypothetical protein